MSANGQVLGTVTVSPPPLTANGVLDPHSMAQRAATTIAELVTPVIVNLRLRLALREQAMRDPLTGLFNRRYLEETLGREIRRSARNQRTVSVLMLDVDHFKSYNDRYGHDAGDAVLRAIGEILRQRIRAEDIACRYGGEEFAVILPDAPLSVALDRAEQIRAGLQRMDLKYAGRSLDPITVSIGLACSSAELSVASALLKAADEALYRAKQEGRNRVCVALPAARTPAQART